MEELASLLENFLHALGIQQNLQIFLVLTGLAFARFVSFINVIPFFGGASVPKQIKVATALAFVLVLYPSLESITQYNTPSFRFGIFGLIFLLVKEIGVGFTLGYTASMIFESIHIAGRMIDAQRGAMMAEMFAPQVQLQVSELGQFKLQFSIVLFVLLGAHRIFIQALFHSFEIIPIMAFPKISPGLSPQLIFIIESSAQMLGIAVQLAAPAVVVLLLTDLFFGLVNRVAPQINVFFLSMPVKMIVGLLVVLLAFPLYKNRYIHYFRESIKAFDYLLRSISELYSV